jgi:hypothetical protein
MGRGALGLLSLVCVVATSGSALAQDDVAHLTWEELVARASKAMAAGDHREALAWAQKAAAIRLSPSLRVFMLGEQRAVGDAAGAFTNAKMCVSDAEDDPKLPMREKILATCHEAVAALESSIGQVAITLPSPLPAGVEVRVNGNAVLPALLALPYPVNPGVVAIDVSASGLTPFHLEVTVGTSVVVPVTVVLKAEEPRCPDGQTVGPDQRTCVAACTAGKVGTSDGKHCCWPGQAWSGEPGACTGAFQCPAGWVAVGGDCAVGAAPVPAPPPPPPPAGSRVVPLVVAGAGAAIAIGGTVAWLAANGKYSTLHTDCTSLAGCSNSEWTGSSSSIKTLEGLGVAGWAVGGATLVGGALWYLLSGSPATPTSGFRLEVDPVARGARASWEL